MTMANLNMPQNFLDDAIVQRNIEIRYLKGTQTHICLYCLYNQLRWMGLYTYPTTTVTWFQWIFFFFWIKFAHRVHTQNVFLFLEKQNIDQFCIRKISKGFVQGTESNAICWKFQRVSVKISLTLGYKQHKHVHTTMLVSSEKNNLHWQNGNVIDSVRLEKIDIHNEYIYTFCDVPLLVNVIHIAHGIRNSFCQHLVIWISCFLTNK